MLAKHTVMLRALSSKPLTLESNDRQPTAMFINECITKFSDDANSNKATTRMKKTLH